MVKRLRRVPGFVLLTLSYTLQGYVGYIFIFWINPTVRAPAAS